jgi:hypothetical protein
MTYRVARAVPTHDQWERFDAMLGPIITRPGEDVDAARQAAREGLLERLCANGASFDIRGGRAVQYESADGRPLIGC